MAAVDTLSGVTIFCRVVEAGSFRKAAHALGISPSGVSKAMSRLEERLGVRLLNRSTRQLSVTAEGAVFYQRCRGILAELDAAEHLLAEARAAPQGQLKLSIPVAFGRMRIVPHLAAFAEAHPRIQLQVSLGDRLVDVVDEGFDIAVRIGTLSPSRLIARRLTSTSYVTCAAPAYLKNRGTPTEIEDLAHHNGIAFVMPQTGRLHPWLFQRMDADEAEVLAVRGNATFDSGEALLEAAKSGLGIVQLQSYLAEDALAAGSLVQVLARYEAQGPPISLLYPQNRYLLPRVRVFVDFLVELLGDGKGDAD